MSYDKAREVEAMGATDKLAEPQTPKVKIERMVRVLKPGFAWNPLIKLPRNDKCPCKSGKKFKHCHLPTMPRAIPENLAKEYREALCSLTDTSVIEFVDDDTNEENAQRKV